MTMSRHVRAGMRHRHRVHARKAWWATISLTAIFFLYLATSARAIDTSKYIEKAVIHKQVTTTMMQIEALEYRLDMLQSQNRVMSAVEVQGVMDDIMEKIGDIMEFFGDLVDKIKAVFAEEADDWKSIMQSRYSPKPLNARELFEGMLAGAGGVLIPHLRDSEDGADAMIRLTECMQPIFAAKEWILGDNLWDVQFNQDNLAPSDDESFVEEIEEPVYSNTGDRIKDFLKEVKDMALSMLNFIPGTKFVKVFGQVSQFFDDLKPTLTSVLKHMSQCGELDIIIGVIIGMVLAVFPALLLIVIPIGIIGFGLELYQQIKNMVRYWKKNWFLFGKALGLTIVYLLLAILLYRSAKANKSNEAPKIACTKSKGCDARMPPKLPRGKEGISKKHFTRTRKWKGQQWRQRDDLIDPFMKNKEGLTNLQLMKKGNAPIGPDGLPVNLHHVKQTPDGPIAELTATFHQVNYKAIHPRLGKPSLIDRGQWDILRTNYWKMRADQIEAEIAKGVYNKFKFSDFCKAGSCKFIVAKFISTDALRKLPDLVGGVMEEYKESYNKDAKFDKEDEWNFSVDKGIDVQAIHNRNELPYVRSQGDVSENMITTLLEKYMPKVQEVIKEQARSQTVPRYPNCCWDPDYNPLTGEYEDHMSDDRKAWQEFDTMARNPVHQQAYKHVENESSADTVVLVFGIMALIPSMGYTLLFHRKKREREYFANRIPSNLHI